MIRLIAVTLMVALVLAARLAYLYLPWWGILGLVVLALALLPRLLGVLARRFALGLFRAKGAALAGAEVRVHAIAPASAPPAATGEQADEDSPPAESEGPRTWYRIDLSIAPVGAEGAFRMWEPSSLVLVPPGTPADESDDRSARIEGVEIWQEQEFRAEEGYKYEGEQRLRLRVGVLQGVDRLRLRYYLVGLGGTFRIGRPAAGHAPQPEDQLVGAAG